MIANLDGVKPEIIVTIETTVRSSMKHRFDPVPVCALSKSEFSRYEEARREGWTPMVKVKEMDRRGRIVIREIPVQVRRMFI